MRLVVVAVHTDHVGRVPAVRCSQRPRVRPTDNAMILLLGSHFVARPSRTTRVWCLVFAHHSDTRSQSVALFPSAAATWGPSLATAMTGPANVCDWTSMTI